LATRSPEKKAFALLLESSGRVLCERCLAADRPFTRMRGLLGRRSLPAGEGLLLSPASAVHTAFMRFTIDVVFLDAHGVVLKVVHGLGPWRAAARRGAKAVLELAAGSALRRGLEPGERLEPVALGEAASAGAYRHDDLAERLEPPSIGARSASR
jgi:uncharacterized membrane protein (UPF0127 family)